MRAKIVPLILLFILTGCMTVYQHPYAENCRNEAAYCALIASEKNEVKISFGPSGPSYWHAQAKVKIGDKWVWLKMINNKCYESEKDNFQDLNDFSVKDFIDYQLIENKGFVRQY